MNQNYDLEDESTTEFILYDEVGGGRKRLPIIHFV